MKMFYATSNKYPSFKYANTGQILVMSNFFSDYLGVNFYLGGKNINVDKGSLIQTYNFPTTKSYILGYKFIKFIKNKKIEKVYCRESRLFFFLILYNKLFFRQELTYIYEIHALTEGKFINNLVEKILSRWVHKFVFITASLRDIYREKFDIETEKTIVVPDAVDLEVFDIDIGQKDARNKLGLPEDKYIIVYTGKFKTMGMDKGISDILKALTFLPQDILFLAVGGTKGDIEYYQTEARKLNIEERIKFISHVSQEILAIYQKTADILLMPFPYNKHYAYYMSPLKMFEYMVSKRPIIASKLPSIQEVLNDDNALLVGPNNPREIACAIQKLRHDEELADKISGQAYLEGCRYTWKKRVEKILNFIKYL